MTLNEALQGKAYAPVTFEVEARRVAGFASAVGQLGEGVPPTFATVLEHAAGMENVIADTELGLDLSKVLHGEQEYEWMRPMRVGETVSFSTTVELGEGVRPSFGPAPRWSSTNPAVVVIDGSGNAKAIARGESTIGVIAHGHKVARHIEVQP